MKKNKCKILNLCYNKNKYTKKGYKTPIVCKRRRLRYVSRTPIHRTYLDSLLIFDIFNVYEQNYTIFYSFVTQGHPHRMAFFYLPSNSTNLFPLNFLLYFLHYVYFDILYNNTIYHLLFFCCYKIPLTVFPLCNYYILS